jgi:sulfhydrogenase subunit beta (sulfur reductase)
MEYLFTFAKNDFNKFFDCMSSLGEVYAPVRVSEQSFSLRAVKRPEQIAFEALRTILPPKKVFFPPKETVLRFVDGQFQEEFAKPEKKVLFGIHPCDLHGLKLMDMAFTSEPADGHWTTRRKEAIIIGLSCLPDKHCFCNSMGTDNPEGPYDMFLTDLQDRYFIQSRTAEGLELCRLASEFLTPVKQDDKDDYKQFWVDRDKLFEHHFSADNVPALIDMEWDNAIWTELGDRCLSCGNCTPVCPTCYCFDVVDIQELDGESSSRVREWDSCQLTTFAQVAGDFNFRATPVDRLKFWYRHKLHGFEDAMAVPSCVGCGRCTVSCPAGIDDLVKVVRVLQNAQDNSSSKKEGE